MTAAEEHKDLVRRFDAVVAACDVDALDELCRQDMVNHACLLYTSPSPRDS